MPNGFGQQLPIIPPSLNDMSLSPNPFNTLATKALVNPTEDRHDEKYSPKSPELSEPSLITTPQMNPSTIEGWETPLMMTDDKIFYSNDELRRICLNHQALPHRATPKAEKNLSLGMSFLKRGGVSQHVREACGQLPPEPKDIPRSSSSN